TVAALPLLAGLSACQKAPPVTMAEIPPGELPDLRRAGLTQLWKAEATLYAGENIRNVWRVGDSIYVATSDARIIRIDAKTGAIRWQQGLGVDNFIIYKPIELKTADGSASKELLVVTGGEVFTFDMATGDETRPRAHLGLSVSCD